MLKKEKIMLQILELLFDQLWKPENEEKDLDTTDDGESSKKSHSASNETQLGFRLDLLVSLDVVKGGRVKVDLHQL